MATTFKSGPRDPVTGRSSARISPDNVVRSDGYTDRERAEISITPEDPRRQNQMRVPEGAGTFQEFMAASGRSSTNPYGDSGLFGGGADLTNNMTPGQIDAVNRLAYNQYLGLVSGRGTQKGGQGEFVPGYAPALKIGSNTPRGRVVAAPNQPKPGGLLRFMPSAQLLQGIFGGGNILRTLDDGGVDYSAEGIETLDAAPVLQPGEAAPVVGTQQPSGFILASTLPREDNGIFNLPLDRMRKIPETGIGGFIEQGKDGFQIGPGTLKPKLDLNDGSFGLTYKIAI